MPALGSCDVCGVGEAVGVAAVPGVPMSLAYCRECLRHGAIPLWVADFTVGQCVPYDDLDWAHVAPWFRELDVAFPDGGGYARLDSLRLVERECDACKGAGRALEDGISVEFADGERVDDACPACYRGKVVGVETGAPA